MRTGIQEGFVSLGEDINRNIPHLKVGSDKPLNDPFVDKMKRWLLVGLTVLVGGGAAILIMIKLIGKFFG